MKNKIIKFRGGHRIGALNATIPLASLTVSHDTLQVKSLFASAEFNPSEVVTIKEVIYIPFIAQGIKIIHTKPHLSKTVIFWSLKDPQKLITTIEETGFLNSST